MRNLTAYIERDPETGLYVGIIPEFVGTQQVYEVAVLMGASFKCSVPRGRNLPGEKMKITLRSNTNFLY
jgi:hypothetical protein